MIAPTARGCKGTLAEGRIPTGQESAFGRKNQRHAIVSGIIIRPNFRQSTAKLDCEKAPTCVGPVLSVPDSSAPSPPGSSGSGLFASYPSLGQRELAFFFWGVLVIAGRGTSAANPEARRAWSGLPDICAPGDDLRIRLLDSGFVASARALRGSDGDAPG